MSTGQVPIGVLTKAASPCVLILKASVISALFGLPSAHASDATVGTGTAASCTEAALNIAISAVQSDIQGGTVRFNCGVAFRTINVSAQKNLTGVIAIDGGGAVTLNGQDTTRVFEISPRPNPEDSTVVTLQNITLRNGFGSGGFGGALLGNGGVQLNLQSVTINDSRAGLSGGAIAMAPNSILNVSDSSFRNNSATDGGAIATSALTNVLGSSFVLNTATGTGNSGQRGAIQSYLQNLNVDGSAFSFNLGHRGGAIYKRDMTDMRINDSTFGDNSAGFDGGAIFADAGVLFVGARDTRFSGNLATQGFGGAANISSFSSEFDRVTFDNNRASFGGAVAVSSAGFTSFIDSTLSSNVAQLRGGALDILGLSTALVAGLSQVTTSNNLVTNGSASDVYIQSADISIFRSTLIGGSASTGAGSLQLGPNSRLTLQESMIASSQGTACTLASSATTQSGGNNLAPSSCLATHASDVVVNSVAGLGLGAFGNYGSRRNGYMPLPGSIALDRYGCGGLSSPELDMRGRIRPVDADGNGTVRCDSGAVERQINEAGPALFRDGFEGN